MKYLALVYIVWAFLKSWYYGLYELKENKNKTAAIAIFFLAIARSNFSYYSFIYIIYSSFNVFNFNNFKTSTITSGANIKQIVSNN